MGAGKVINTREHNIHRRQAQCTCSRGASFVGVGESVTVRKDGVRALVRQCTSTQRVVYQKRIFPYFFHLCLTYTIDRYSSYFTHG